MVMCNKGITQFYLPPTHKPYLPLLPSHKASPPSGQYQLVLLGEQRHIGVVVFVVSVAVAAAAAADVAVVVDVVVVVVVTATTNCSKCTVIHLAVAIQTVLLLVCLC